MLLRSDMSMVDESEPESSEEYFCELEKACCSDVSWNETMTHAPEHPPRCQHCRHWIGQSDIAQHMQHVLNGCRVFLQQGRYDWRHDSVLNYIARCMKSEDSDGLRWHCDLPGYRTLDGGTVPDQLVLTDLRPDICILDQRKERPSVVLIEVTITWDGRLDAARQEKNVKYAELMSKISRLCPVQFLSLEIGSFHQKLSDNSRWSLKSLYNFTAQLEPFEVFEENILRITEICSYKIFAESLNAQWDSNLSLPIPPAHVPPETTTTHPETDLNSDQIESLAEEFKVDTRVSPDLIRDIPERDDYDSSDPSRPDSPEMKVAQPSEKIPEISRVEEPCAETTSSRQRLVSATDVLSSEEKINSFSEPKKYSKNSLSAFEVIIVFLILMLIFAILYFIWNNLGIFMPIFAFVYLVLRYLGKA